MFYSNQIGEIVEAEVDLENESVRSTRIVPSVPTIGVGFIDIHPEDGLVLIPSAASISNRTITPYRPILDVVVDWTGTLPRPQK